MTANDNYKVQGDAGYAGFELEVVINAPREKVWRTFGQAIDTWWLPSFHMVGEGSVMTLDLCAGGQLLERKEGGGSLLWGTVQMVEPGTSVHLSGLSAPEWGGPHLSVMRFAFVDTPDGGTRVTLAESILGRVDEGNLASLREGWTELLQKGLKSTVETGGPAT